MTVSDIIGKMFHLHFEHVNRLGLYLSLMKKIILALLVAGCSTNTNDLMTDLVNEEKAIKSGIASARYREGKFRDSTYVVKDTLQAKMLRDSMIKYFMLGDDLKDRLKEVQFSIDSLGKMK